MASLGDRITRKVGVAITVEFPLKQAGVLQTGLSPVVEIFDEADASFSTPTVSEPIPGIYRAMFTPDATGIWHAVVTESTIPFEDARSYDVASEVAGDVLGRIEDSLILRSFTAAASSSTSEVRTGGVGPANDFYKGQAVVVIDISGGVAAVRHCRQSFSVNDRIVFDELLPFTPEAGVDPVYVLSLRPGFRLHELLGSPATANPFLLSWLDLMLNKDAGQTFDQGTDSQEAIREAIDAVPADVDAVLTAAHGAGSWTGSGGSGGDCDQIEVVGT